MFIDFRAANKNALVFDTMLVDEDIFDSVGALFSKRQYRRVA